jgi:hypothetical protein
MFSTIEKRAVDVCLFKRLLVVDAVTTPTYQVIAASYKEIVQG